MLQRLNASVGGEILASSKRSIGLFWKMDRKCGMRRDEIFWRLFFEQ